MPTLITKPGIELAQMVKVEVSHLVEWFWFVITRAVDIGGGGILEYTFCFEYLVGLC